MLGISNLRQEKFEFFRGGLPLPRAFLLYDAIINIVQRHFFLSFCFIKDHPHLSRDLKKKRENNVLVFINIEVSIGYTIDDHTYVFRSTGCVNTTELATIIGIHRTW